MIRGATAFLIAFSFLFIGAGNPAPSSSPVAVVTLKNPINVSRSSETVVLQAAELQRLLSVDDIRRVHVREESSGHDVLVQAVDTNDDGKFEELIFQTDIGPQETQKFELSVGDRQVLRREDFKAYGRFVEERRDDFAWENDRVAHRMYGAALETWAQEPLTSTAVDVWTKRARRLVINDWYMVDDYHRDHGEGGDFYSAGSSRGCGGTGLWVGGRLYPSANFRRSHVFANGPIRVVFELAYETWDAGGVRVSEVKRITLDAGQNLSRFESHYAFQDGPRDLLQAVGIRKVKGSNASFNRERGLVRNWEPLQSEGELGCGILINPAEAVDFPEDKGNYLVTTRIPPNNTAVHYAGFGWTNSGDFHTVEDWDRYLENYAARLRSPLEVRLAAR
jgi:hypothetical protein